MRKIIAVLAAIGAVIVFASASVSASDASKAFAKCKACHKTDSDNSKWTLGPGLQGVGKRLSGEYLEKWLKDPQATFDAGGPEIDSLKAGAKFNAKLKMPAVTKSMSDEDRRALIDYLLTL